MRQVRQRVLPLEAASTWAARPAPNVGKPQKCAACMVVAAASKSTQANVSRTVQPVLWFRRFKSA
jgi:hypothetical protein